MKNRKKIVPCCFAWLLVLLTVAVLCGCTRKQEQGNELEDFFAETETAAEDASLDSAGEMTEEVLTDSEIKMEVAQPQLCYVHICGAVKNPGVYCMVQGNRIFEVIEAAGGFTEDACVDYVNQANVVSDGMKLWIPSLSEAEEMGWKHPNLEETAVGSADLGENAEDAGDMININTATSERLCSLSGIGTAKARAIIAYREAHGGFARKEDIMKVEGIKQSGYEKIKDWICVGQE